MQLSLMQMCEGDKVDRQQGRDSGILTSWGGAI